MLVSIKERIRGYIGRKKYLRLAASLVMIESCLSTWYMKIIGMLNSFLSAMTPEST